jgi:hypothetical protein
MPMAAISLPETYFSDSFCSATNLRRPNLIWVMFYHPGFGNICSNGFEKYTVSPSWLKTIALEEVVP